LQGGGQIRFLESWRFKLEILACPGGFAPKLWGSANPSEGYDGTLNTQQMLLQMASKNITRTLELNT
jgi:hypothetical protein